MWIYRCSECGAEYRITPEIMVCPVCARVQQSEEPLRGILECAWRKKPLKGENLLPVEARFFPAIPVGNTPLWEPKRLRETSGFKKLYIKDDSKNPTGSLKDRASYLVAAFAKKHKLPGVVVASTGNAASSMAGVGAAAGLRVTIFIPKNAPRAKMVQSLQYGARVILVDGNYDKAYDLSVEYWKKTGELSRNTALNPLTIEGKKTAALEMVTDLGKAPDIIYVSAGDGVIASGLYKGFRDLLALRRIRKIPKIIAVQAEGSSAIHRAIRDGGRFHAVPSRTIADSIAVDVPRCGYYLLRQLRNFGGETMLVSDEEIFEAQRMLSSSSGLFSEPAAATAWAGFWKKRGQTKNTATVVVLITGNGLKDIDSAMLGVKVPVEAISRLDEIK